MLSCITNTETYKWSICNAIPTSVFRRSILTKMLAISSFLNFHTSASPTFFSLPPSVILDCSNLGACLTWLSGPFSTARARTAVYHGLSTLPSSRQNLRLGRRPYRFEASIAHFARSSEASLISFNYPRTLFESRRIALTLAAALSGSMSKESGRRL